jgi:hypothetical protein
MKTCTAFSLLLVLFLPLGVQGQSRPGRALLAKTGVDRQEPSWTDPVTGLMWATQDNGSDVNWNQAKAYCSDLRLGKYSNWRMPAIEELAQMYVAALPESACGLARCRIKGGITPSEHDAWSSSSVGNSEGALIFDFSDGKRYLWGLNTTSYLRAFCVRTPAK